MNRLKHNASPLSATGSAVSPPASTEYLIRDPWLRSDLALRDRSLVTVAAPISVGQVEQITFHLNRVMDSGLTEEQVAEMITHLAFCAGWPNAMSALPVAKAVFEK